MSIFDWFKKGKPPQIWKFPRGQIQELQSTALVKKYKIVSDDGERDAFLLLEIESLEFLSNNLLNSALNTIGDITAFLAIYGKQRTLVARQKPPIDCNKRLTLSWVRQDTKEIAWIIDFRATLTDRLITLRLFPKIAAYQFVEESDWYFYVVTQDWAKILSEAITESDLVTISPFSSDLVTKRIKRQRLAKVNQKLQLYWKLKGIGEHTPAALPSQVRLPPTPQIPYEAIAALVIEKYRNQL